MYKWKNMRRGMAVILAAAMVGQSVPVYASDFEAEIETVSNFSEHTGEEEEDIVIIPQEKESDAQIEADEKPELENQIEIDEIIIIEEETERQNLTEADENTSFEEETETETENQIEAIGLIDVEEAAESVDIRETESTEKEERSAETEAEIVDYGTCSYGLTWTLDSEGVLRVDGTGTLSGGKIYSSKRGKSISDWTELEIKSIVTGENITAISSSTFKNCSNLTSIELPEVETIGEYAFYGCSGLTNIELPEVQTTEDYAFYACSNLTSIELPKAHTIGKYVFAAGSETNYCSSLISVKLPKVKEIGSSAFWNCSSLTSIELPKVKEIGSSAFGRCSSLANIELPKVQEIGEYAFYCCSSLTSIELPKVKIISRSVFAYCSSLTSIELPEVEEIGYQAFYGCSSLSDIELPKVQTIEMDAFRYCGMITIELPEVQTIGKSAFNCCGSLTSIDFSKVETIGESAFKYCMSLTSINLPKVQNIGTAAFGCCSNLTSIELPEVKTINDFTFSDCSSLSSIELPEAQTIGNSVFSGCSSLSNVELPKAQTIGNSVFGCSLWGGGYNYCDSLKSIELPEVQTIGETAFSGCSSLTSVELPEVQTIGKSAFIGCSSLTSIELPEVQTIEETAFIGCSSLTSINFSKVETIGESAFKDCSSLTSINLPKVQTIEKAVFKNCSSLISVSSIELPEVETIGAQAFSGCSSLISVELPKLKKIGESAFGYILNEYTSCGCSSLTSIDLSNVETIGARAFMDCSSLNNIEIPKVQALEAQVFYGCSSLTSIDLSNIKTIGRYAFCDCVSLTEINIPEGITKIENGAFNGTTKLTKITLPDSLEVIGAWAFYGSGFFNLVIPDSVQKIGKKAFACSAANSTIGQITFEGNYPENGIEEDAFWNKPILAFVKGDSWTSHLEDTYGGRVNWRTEEPVVSDVVYAYGSTEDSKTSYCILGADGTLAVYGDGYIIDSGLVDKSVIKKVEFVESACAISDNAFSNCISLESIDIPEGVKSIGNYAFSGCTSLQRVSLPEGLQTIHSEAFSSSQIKKIVLPSTVTSIDSNAFRNIRPELIIFRGDAPSMTSDSFADIGDKSNIKVYYSTSTQWSEENKLLLENWGEVCTYDRVILGEYHYNNDETCISDGTETAECICDCGQTDTRTVEGTKNPDKHTYTDNYEILPDGRVNYYCDVCGMSQVEINASGECGASLTWKIYDSNILTISGTGNMFDYDDDNPAPWSGKNIKYCKIESGVTSIGSAAFQDCTDLTDIIIEDGIETIGDYAFYGCTGLTEVQLPESVYSIGEVAFGNCTSLEKLTAYEGLTQIADNSFRKCNVLTLCGYTGTMLYEHAEKKGITFESLGYLGTCGDGMEWRLIGDELTISGESTMMIDYTPTEKAPWSGLNVKHCTVKEGVGNIGSYAFADCATLTEIELPDTIQAIGKNAFKGCTGLAEIKLPDTIQNIDSYAFADCAKLTKAVLPSTITEIEESVFAGCASLTEVELPDSVTKIGNRAFAGCTSLQTVNHSGMLTEIGEEAFKGCTGLETFAIPDSITEIKKGTFDGCALTTVQLPSALQTIGSRAFAGNSLTEIAIPASVTDMDRQAFVGCEQLQEYVVDGENSSYSSANGFLYNKEKTILISCPAGKTGSVSVSRKVEMIGDYAFSDCKKITELMLPTTLNAIGSYAFENMTLSKIEIPADVTSIGAYAFKGCLQLMSIDVEAENQNFASQNGILCNAEKTSVKLCPPGLKNVTLWEGITEISAGSFAGMAEDVVIDLPFSMESISSENDFGTTTVFRVYDNAIIKWILQSSGYKYESKGNYSLPWDSADSYHIEMAYMQLRDNLSKKTNGTYKVTGETISYKMQLTDDGIDYQFTFRDSGNSEMTISFQLGKGGVIADKYTMKFQALKNKALWYSGTLYKSQNVFKSSDQKTFTWNIYDPNKIVNTSTANQLASTTLYLALTYLSNCLYYCGGLKMKDIGFTSYYTVDTIHTVTSDSGKAPTCTEAGRTGNVWCSICGAIEIEGDVLPATGHKETVIPAKAATCTENGWTAGKKCSVCGKILKAPTESDAALGHDMKEVIDSYAKCETAGSKHNECTRCGAKESKKTIPATGHKEEVIPAKNETCTEDGLTEGRRCSVCGKVLKKQETTVKALGHQLKVVIDKEATCGEAGSRHEECKRCGYKSAQEKIPATGNHKYGNYQVTSEPTALAAGTKTRICSVCGNKETISIAKLEPTIELNATSIKLKVKQSTTKVTVSGLAKGDSVASWKSSNPKIVTVNNAGKITAKNKTGSAVLTVTLKSGKQATVKVKVQKTEVKTTKISGLSKNITLKVKEKATLKPILSPITSVQKLTYKTSNKKVAAVSKKGVITAKKAGKAKITVQAGTKKFVVTVTVKK